MIAFLIQLDCLSDFFHCPGCFPPGSKLELVPGAPSSAVFDIDFIQWSEIGGVKHAS